MCLAVPGRIIQIDDSDPVMVSGKVDFAGIVKDISLAFVPDARVGDYVIVHAGMAIKKINEEEAMAVFNYLNLDHPD